MQPLGCFGLATTHDPQAWVCIGCELEPECAQRAYEARLEIQKTIDVGRELIAYSSRDDLKHFERPDSRRAPHCASKTRQKKAVVCPSGDQMKLIAALPVKARRVVERCYRQGIDVKGDLRVGKNPFAHTGPAFMGVVCSKALAGKFSKADARKAIENENPHWSPQTVTSHVYIALWALSVFGLRLDRDTNRYYLRNFS